jgi:hypothetical protein
MKRHKPIISYLGDEFCTKEIQAVFNRWHGKAPHVDIYAAFNHATWASIESRNGHSLRWLKKNRNVNLYATYCRNQLLFADMLLAIEQVASNPEYDLLSLAVFASNMDYSDYHRRHRIPRGPLRYKEIADLLLETTGRTVTEDNLKVMLNRERKRREAIFTEWTSRWERDPAYGRF